MLIHRFLRLKDLYDIIGNMRQHSQYSLVLLIGSVLNLLISGCHEVSFHDLSTMGIKYQFINLKSATERRETLEAELTLAKVNYKVIDAVYGKALTPKQIEALVNHQVYDQETAVKKTLSPGELGVYLSNLQKALPNAVENKNSITVTFEDDVVIPYDIDGQFRQALKAVPDDFDILYLGCYHNYLVSTKEGKVIGPYTPTRLPGTEEYRWPLCNASEKTRVFGTPWVEVDGGCVAGLYAYAVTEKSAAKLLKLLVPIRVPIDMAITELVGKGKIRAYCLKPELIRVNTAIPSTIR